MVKNLLADAGDMWSIPGSGNPPGEGNGNTPVFLPGESHTHLLAGWFHLGVGKAH